jgi:hypothetical protein
VAEESNFKKPVNLHRKRAADSEVSNILSDAARSIEQLVSIVTARKSENSGSAVAREPEDDDWWFCKRVYHKLRNMPDGHEKEYFKYNMDTELFRMTYGQNPRSTTVGI